MHLLTFKRLTFPFINPPGNAALKFYVISLTSCNFVELHAISWNFMQFHGTLCNFIKVEPQSVQVCSICTIFRYNQTQFKRVEVPSLGHHMLFPRLSDPSYELERTISHSHVTI